LPASAPNESRRSGGLGTNPKKPATEAKVRIGRIEKNVSLEDATGAAATEALQLADQAIKVRNAEFDFGLANRATAVRHG
jgi:hypothetical protein